MHRMSTVFTKIAVRMVIAAAFTVFWYFSNERNVSPNAPLVFFGALWLAGAWFSYLKGDGLSFLNKRGVWRLRGGKMEGKVKEMLDVKPHEERLISDAPEPDSAETVRVNILSNVLSGVILIAVSFFF